MLETQSENALETMLAWAERWRITSCHEKIRLCIKGSALEKKMLLIDSKQCNHSLGKNEGVTIRNLWSFYSPSTSHITRDECE